MEKAKQRDPNAAKLLSMIIPLYNVSEFATAATASITSQAFEGLEVILVDDGSTDGSLQLFTDGLRGIDIVTISQENKGPGAARNAGIKAATGEYVMYLDGDDFLLPHAFENIRQALEINDYPDVLFGRYLRWIPKTGLIKGKEYDFKPPQDPRLRTEYIISALPEPSWNVWRYISRRSIIIEHAILFEEGVLCEDVKWVLLLLDEADTIAFLNEPFYAYNYHRPGSIVNSFTVKKLIDLNTIIAEQLPKYHDRPEITKRLIMESFYTINEYCAYRKEDRKLIFDSYRSVLPYYRLSDSRLHRVAGKVKNRTLFYLMSVCMYTTKKLRRLMLRIIRRGIRYE